MKLALGADTELEITGYNKCLDDTLIAAMANDNADEAAKVFHLMLCGAGMTGNPKPNLQELYVDEVEQAAVAKNPNASLFLDANGKPKAAYVQEYDFPLGLLDDVKKYLGLGDWDTPNNLVKSDEFFLSSLYNKYGHDMTESAIDYLEG